MAQDSLHAKTNQQQVHHHHNQQPHHQQQQQQHHQNQHQQQRRQHQHQHLNPNQIAHDEDVCEELVSLPYRKAYEMAEKFATTRIGQYLIARGDRLLKTIETTAKWSLPQDQSEDKLQRPLSWIPFLMVIITLRWVRIWASVGAMVIGNAPIAAEDVVYFIQTRRRKLRALRLRGVKEISRREMEAKARKSNYNKNSFMNQLKKVFSSAICRPGHHREPERRVIIHRAIDQESENEDREQQATKRPRAEESDSDLTVDELLNKYEHLNTDEDSDFVPNPKETSTDNSDTSTASSEGVDEAEAEHEKVGHHTNENQTERHRNRNTKASSINDSVELKENGNNETVTMPMPIQEIKQESSAEHENSEKVKKSHDDRPANGVENREKDVAFKFELTPPGPQNLKSKNSTLTEDDEALHEPTSENVSSAVKRQPLSTMNITSVAAKIEPETTLTEEVDFEQYEIENFPQEITTSNNDSSPTLSASSSSSSLASFIQNENSLTKREAYASATTTPTTDDLESTTITSISSSEDDFYSPIGSPPDFNSFQQRQPDLKFTNTQNQSPTFQNTVSDPNIGETSALDDNVFRGQTGQTSRRGPQHSQNGNSQPQRQRFHGRNRR